MKTKKKEEKNQIKKEDFAISYVSSEMGDAYNNFDFWSDLKDIAGRLGIPKQK